MARGARKKPPPVGNPLYDDRRRRKRGIASGVVVVALLLAGATGVAMLVRRKAESPATPPFSQLSACLIGAPLDAGEKPSFRIRGVELSFMSLPQEKRWAGGTPWPSRCTTYAHAVAEKLQLAGLGGPIVDSSEKLAAAIQDPSKGMPADLGALVDAVWKDADAAKITARAASDVEAAPAPAKPLGRDGLSAEARVVDGVVVGLAKSVHPDVSPGDTLRFLVDQKDLPGGPLVCTMPPGQAALACAHVPEPAAALSPALRLLGTTDDGAPVRLFVGDRGKAGIFRADTGAADDVSVATEYGAYGFASRSGGGFAALGWKDDKPEVRLLRSDGTKRVETKLLARADIANPYYVTGLLWDWVFYEQPNKAGDVHVVARKVPADGDVGAAVDLGVITPSGWGGDNHFTACRAGQTTTLVVRAGEEAGYAVSFMTADRWTPFVTTPPVSGLSLSCSGAEAAFAGADRAVVEDARCNASGCEPGSANVDDVFAANHDTMPRGSADVFAADVGGKVLLAWRAGDSAGVRTRFAKLESLAKTPDTIFADDYADKGATLPDSWLVEMRVLQANDAALLLLATTAGLYAYRADATGALAPVTVTIAGGG